MEFDRDNPIWSSDFFLCFYSMQKCIMLYFLKKDINYSHFIVSSYFSYTSARKPFLLGKFAGKNLT